MASDNRILRSINELSLAAWFGGSLMGATGLRRAAAVAEHPTDAEDAGWAAWQPVQAVAVVAQVISGAGLTVANRRRYVAQRGVAGTSLLRTAVTGGAIASTVLAARSGRELSASASNAGADRAELRRLEQRARMLQALVSALTGGLVVLDAVMGEQQRPQQVAQGVLTRLVPGR
jgi:hypothetical protein